MRTGRNGENKCWLESSFVLSGTKQACDLKDGQSNPTFAGDREEEEEEEEEKGQICGQKKRRRKVAGGRRMKYHGD
jgi:hypothetical protein